MVAHTFLRREPLKVSSLLFVAIPFSGTTTIFTNLTHIWLSTLCFHQFISTSTCWTQHMPRHFTRLWCLTERELQSLPHRYSHLVRESDIKITAVLINQVILVVQSQNNIRLTEITFNTYKLLETNLNPLLDFLETSKGISIQNPLQLFTVSLEPHWISNLENEIMGIWEIRGKVQWHGRWWIKKDESGGRKLG